jgi:hypothetical protein
MTTIFRLPFFSFAIIVAVALMLIATPALAYADNTRMLWRTVVGFGSLKFYANAHLDSTDLIVVHLGEHENTVTQAQNDTLKQVTTVPNSRKGFQFFSLDSLSQNAPIIKAAGLGFISYDLERTYSPDAEADDPVGSFIAAKQIATSNGLKLMGAPSGLISNTYADDLAPYVWWYHLQSQARQDNDSTCTEMNTFVKNKVIQIEGANPTLEGEISYETTLADHIAPGDPDSYTSAKRCIDKVSPGDVDAWSNWFNVEDWNSGQYQDLLTYHENTYS